jgi:3'-phosphoadenosine 5'-phosphosulfate sulfotransferase (PAPS reductase)/FAD synthetase
LADTICLNDEPIEGTDTQMDFEDARDMARTLANRYGMVVNVSVQDEDDKEFETRKYAPKIIKRS